MAKFSIRKKRDGTFTVAAFLGEKGSIRYTAFKQGITRPELPAAVGKQAELVKEYRDSLMVQQDTPSEPGIVQ